MPTSKKPRKPQQSIVPNTSGKVWADLSEMHRTCLSNIQSTASVGTILQNAEFVQAAVDRPRMTSLVVTLTSQIKNYFAALNKIRDRRETARTPWDDANTERQLHWKNNDRERAVSCVERMEIIEFSAIQIGESYQSWIAAWTQEVTPNFLELMNLMQQTHTAMEKAQHVSN